MQIKRTNLRYPFDMYNPAVLTYVKPLSDREMREEYKRLRRIAEKRLQRIKEGGYEESSLYRYHHGRYKPLSEIRNGRELVYSLSDVAEFVSHPGKSLKGIQTRELRIKASLKESGYEISDIKAFGDFMEIARHMLGEYIYDSERLATFYEQYERAGRDVDKRTLRRYLKSQKKGKRKVSRGYAELSDL